MRSIYDLLVEFENRIRNRTQMRWNFLQVSIEADTEVGLFLLNLAKDVRGSHWTKVIKAMACGYGDSSLS